MKILKKTLVMTILAIVAGIIPALAATPHATSISSLPATFNYAKATAIDDTTASVVINLTTVLIVFILFMGLRLIMSDV